MQKRSIEEINKWRSSDFYTAVIVKSVGFPLESISKENERFVTFVFNAETNECQDLLSKHWNGELNINSKVIIDTIKELKTRLHEVIRGSNYDA